MGSPTYLKDIQNSSFSPKVALVWQPTSMTTIKGSIGRAFRAPTIYDLYRTYSSRPGRIVYSNPDLDPETVWNYEIGVVQYFADKLLKISGTVFNADIDNLIYTYDGTDGNSYKDNAGQARIRGIELTLDTSPTDFLRLWANYTYNDSEITKQRKDPQMEGKKITGMTDRTINVGGDFIYSWFKTSLTGQYAGRVYKTKYNTDIPDVYKANSKTWIWDAKMSADLSVVWDGLKNATLSIYVENLFDETYYHYSIGRGRSYFTEVAFFKILFGDEASFPQWGSLTHTWGKRGKQPVCKTSGVRKGYKVAGFIEYFTGRFFFMGHEGRLNSEVYEKFIKEILTKTRKHIIIVQDGAPYHTSKAMKQFFKKHSKRLAVFQLPSYSPDYNPIEKLWKKIKEKEVHLHYFPTFDSLKKKVNHALLNFTDMKEEILSLFVKYKKLSNAESY